ncbi:hypothetical protein HDV05_008590, partial [Chytridiales sp. JEL 0842]
MTDQADSPPKSISSAVYNTISEGCHPFINALWTDPLPNEQAATVKDCILECHNLNFTHLGVMSQSAERRRWIAKGIWGELDRRRRKKKKNKNSSKTTVNVPEPTTAKPSTVPLPTTTGLPPLNDDEEGGEETTEPQPEDLPPLDPSENDPPIQVVPACYCFNMTDIVSKLEDAGVCTECAFSLQCGVDDYVPSVQVFKSDEEAVKAFLNDGAETTTTTTVQPIGPPSSTRPPAASTTTTATNLPTAPVVNGGEGNSGLPVAPQATQTAGTGNLVPGS